MDELRNVVWQRAAGRCGYCQIAQAHSVLPFQIDHIIARKRGGKTILSNLALSCFYDNSFKGSDISSVDSASSKLTPLFNPRKHSWRRNFRWNGPILDGLTAIGRVTILLLQINHPLRVEQRAALMEAHLFPPGDPK